MLRVACEDIGVLGCHFVAQAEKASKVESKMLEHMRETHPQLVAGLSYEQHKDLESRITSRARAVETGGDQSEAGTHAILTVRCADMGGTDCDFVAVGQNEWSLRQRIFDHLRDIHPEMMAGMTVEELDEFERGIRTAAHPE
jgi:predicted small metal-binding protein